MPVVAMKDVSRSVSQVKLNAGLPDLADRLSSFPRITISSEQCATLAAAALAGQPEAQFMVGSIFDAVDESTQAIEWYSRSAARDYLPAMLQLCAMR